MTAAHRSMGLLAIACALILGCGQSNDNASARGGQTASTQSADVQVAKIELGRNVDADERITERTDDFRPNDTIYASVITSGVADNAQITARWTYQDGQIVHESSETIAPTGSAATAFYVTKPDGWPAGKYKVEIFVNGQSAGSQEFEVGRS